MPCRSMAAPPNACSSKLQSSLIVRRSSSAGAMISGPIPSPGRVMILGMARRLWLRSEEVADERRPAGDDIAEVQVLVGVQDQDLVGAR